MDPRFLVEALSAEHVEEIEHADAGREARRVMQSEQLRLRTP